jgi:predicted DNA-binding transcriptional regulator YafY
MSRPASTVERLERLLVMVPWLLRRPDTSLDDIADRFGTTPEELAGDLDLLGYCGLPGYGGGDLVEVTIVGDRVSLRMADFFERPLRLSVREAIVLLLAARVLAAVEGLPDSEELRSAQAKLERALGSATAGEADIAGAQVTVDLSAPGDEHLPELRRALEQRRIVRLTYCSGTTGELSERDVEPWALTAAHGFWYLQGHCRQAGAQRDFRLDRIRVLVVSDEAAEPPRDPGAIRPPTYRPGPDDLAITLDLSPPAWWVAEWAVVDAVAEHDDVRRVTLRTRSLDWAARLVLRVAPHAHVVAPAELAQEVRRRARVAAERYRPRKTF